MKPTVLVCCASSVATSTVIAVKVRDIFETERLDVNVVQSSFAEMASKVDMVKPCLILATGSVTPPEGVPLLVATPFLTGIGKETVIDQMLMITRSAIAGR